MAASRQAFCQLQEPSPRAFHSPSHTQQRAAGRRASSHEEGLRNLGWRLVSHRITGWRKGPARIAELILHTGPPELVPRPAVTTLRALPTRISAPSRRATHLSLPILPPTITVIPSRTRSRSPGADFEPAPQPSRIRACGARRIPVGSLCLAAPRTAPSSRLHVGRAGAATRSPAVGGGSRRRPSGAGAGGHRRLSAGAREEEEEREEGEKDYREAARSPRRHVQEAEAEDQ